MITTLLKQEISIFKFFENVYIFGSVFTSENPNDLDILLVYKKKKIMQLLEEVEILKSKLCAKVNNIELDLLLLNEEELKQTQFLSKIFFEKVK